MIKPTITDIANEMGITPSTVSRALAGSPRVKESTREAIERKAKEMGYERNVMASNLRKGVAKTVGIIVPRINRQFFSNVISSAESILEEAGYTVIICQSHETLEDEIKALKTMRANQVAGVLISHSIQSVNGDHILENIHDGVELVQFDRVFDNLPGIKVVNDGVKGSYEATKSLIANGYNKIGTLAGYLGAQLFKDRKEGYVMALKEAGMPVDEDIIFEDSILRATGYQSALKAIERGCDALYCAGDFSALGAFDAVREAGLDVPGQFGIIGTANEHFTGLMSPTMSSLEQRPDRMGTEAARAFLDAVEGKQEDRKIVIPMELIIRQSSSRKQQQ